MHNPRGYVDFHPPLPNDPAYLAQINALMVRMNIVAHRAAWRLRRLAEGNYHNPQTWIDFAEQVGLYCVPLLPGQVSGHGYYVSPTTAAEVGYRIPRGWGVIFYDVSVSPLLQCHILVHELIHDILESWETTLFPDDPVFVWEGETPTLEHLPIAYANFLGKSHQLFALPDDLKTPIPGFDDAKKNTATTINGTTTLTNGSMTPEEVAETISADELLGYYQLRRGVHHLISRQGESLTLYASTQMHGKHEDEEVGDWDYD